MKTQSAQASLDKKPSRTVCDLAYVIQSDLAEAIVKVGKSNSPDFRIKGIQSSVPFRLKTIAILNDGSRREAEMKKLLSDVNVKGEWFKPDQRLNEYLRQAFTEGGLLEQHKINSEFVEQYIKPIVVDYMNGREPTRTTGGDFVYRFLREGFPAISGRMEELIYCCPNAVSPEIVKGFVPISIGAAVPKISPASVLYSDHLVTSEAA